METIIINGVQITRLPIGTVIFADRQSVEVRSDSNVALNALFDRLKQATA
jgi:hypothetical protein